MPEKRVTINLTLRGVAALELVQQVTGDNATDVINDALRLLALVVENPGTKVFLVIPPDEQFQRIHVL